MGPATHLLPLLLLLGLRAPHTAGDSTLRTIITAIYTTPSPTPPTESMHTVTGEYPVVRLVNGWSPCAGQVQWYLQGSWQNVCLDEWSMDQASTTCQELGCGQALSIPNANCIGSSPYMSECAGNGWQNSNGSSQCEEAGTICSASLPLSTPENLPTTEFPSGSTPPTITPTTPNEPPTEPATLPPSTMEVLTTITTPATPEAPPLSPRTLDPAGWTTEYPVTTPTPPPPSWYLEGSTQRMSSPVLGSTPGSTNMMSPDIPVRLAGGTTRCQGRVEAFYDGSWGSICSAGWQSMQALTVCRQLSCGSVYTSSAYFGPGNGNIALSNVQCSWNDFNLAQCSYSVGNTSSCNDSYAIGVICSDGVQPIVPGLNVTDIPVQLVDGGNRCEGRVEVYYNGSWGTVCGNGWQAMQASTVCTQLNCGPDYTSNAFFGPGSGKIMLSNVQCTFSDTNLAQCGYSLGNPDNCTHWDDIGVICTDGVPATTPDGVPLTTLAPVMNTTGIAPEMNITVPVSLTCTSEYMEAAIFNPFLLSVGYSASDVSLNNPNCLPEITPDFTIFNFTYSDCGTVKQVENITTTYSNTIRAYPHGGLITRQKRLVLDLHCQMSQETIVEFVYMPEDTIEISETEEGHYDVAIAFFQSPSFYERVVQSPYYVGLDQELFVQATLETSDPGLQLLVDTCEASPDPQNTTLQTYGLIRHGCVEDTTYQFYPSPSMDVARFSFRAFEFLKEHSSVYLRCKMAVCSVNDPSSFCTQGCFSRRKRSLGTPHQEVEVIVGPIQLLQ